MDTAHPDRDTSYFQTHQQMFLKKHKEKIRLATPAHTGYNFYQPVMLLADKRIQIAISFYFHVQHLPIEDFCGLLQKYSIELYSIQSWLATTIRKIFAVYRKNLQYVHMQKSE